MPDDGPRYRGRFAPSPTGELHFGSLVTAMASYCDARSHGGLWYLRIDDIDPPREQPGTRDRIPLSLTRFGFRWDGSIRWQSACHQRHVAALTELHSGGSVYRCRCTRRQLAGRHRYPGTCRPPGRPSWSSAATGQEARIQAQILSSEPQSTALRVRLDDTGRFDDGVFGHRIDTCSDGVPDVVVKRRDGRIAYHLAGAVDDSLDATHVVRGADLLDCTFPQRAIQDALKLPSPAYLHVPLAVRSDGSKLSKHTLARSIDEWPVLPTLLQAWEFLGQTRCKPDSIAAFWEKAFAQWRRSSIPVCNAKIQHLDVVVR